MYISWLLKSDTDLRAKQYYVWDLRQRRLWANRTVPGTPENLSIQTMLKDHPYPIDLSREEHIVEDARKQLKSIDTILKQPVFKPINYQFDKIKKRDFDEHWYAPSGVRSLREIARKLDVLPEYTIFYASFSNVVHSQAIQKHISIERDGVIFQPTRYLESIAMVLNTSITLAIKIYRQILMKYREGEVENFGRKYSTEWRTRFFSIKDVKYKRTFQDPI